uniref:Uncharacterized protein n=1 Tax=viral metagenome TaxID=1070528 RepID=A0A6C0EX55_9ZZZZ
MGTDNMGTDTPVRTPTLSISPPPPPHTRSIAPLP